MDRKHKKTRFMRDYETYCKASKYVNESRNKRLSREFKRVPYGLAVKGDRNESEDI